jgi:hypothetical protein
MDDKYNIFDFPNNPNNENSKSIDIDLAHYLLIEIMIRHNLTQEAIEDIMQFSNLISGQKIFKKTFRTILKRIPENSSKFNYYFFCKKCGESSGPFTPENSIYRNLKNFKRLFVKNALN